TELVVEAFILEVPLFLGHPFLQAKMRFDDELGHASPLLWFSRVLAGQQQPPPVAFLPCSATRRVRIILTCSSIRRRAPAASRISISPASSRCTSRMRRATAGVRVRLCAGQATCSSETSCTTSTRLCDAAATARWKSRQDRVYSVTLPILAAASSRRW